MAVFILNCAVFCVLCLIGAAVSSKLNVPRVLLPIFEDFSTNFTLEATEGGCYTWSTTRPDLVSLRLLDVDPDTGCALRAVVSCITKERTRNLAVVLAKDIHTRQVLRCDVIVDVISSLEITTTTRELFMEAAPEAFEVRANDDQGNEFTTLEGVEFLWSIVCNGPDKNLNLLRFIMFRESPYETPSTVMFLEEINKRGHIVLLEGIKTGSARVIVKLPNIDYKNLDAAEVNLTVVANLIMFPTDVHMMVGDVINFKILHIHNGQMDEIKFADSQYYLDVEETTVATSDKKSGAVSALMEGKTRVFLHDKNVAEFDPPLKMPSATIHVEKPAYMMLNVLPHKNWNILVGNRHDIVAEIFTSTDHKMHLGPGVEIHMQIGDEFHVEERVQNGSWVTGYAIKEGMSDVHASVQTIIHEKFGKFNLPEALAAQKKLLIYPRIKLKPSEVILPWDPHLKPKYEVDIEATGGDGKFLWSSSNHSMGVVTQSGHVRTHGEGFFEVSAAMTRNHHNRQTAKFLILPPTRLEIVDFVMEAEVGSPIFLHIALYAEAPGQDDKPARQIPFTNCQDLPFKVRPAEPKFIQNKTAVSAPVGIACANVAVVGLAVGSSKITITYYHEGNALEDSVTVSAFKPLRLIAPKTCEIILPVGTDIDFVYSGGPKPQMGQTTEFKRIVKSSRQNVVRAIDVTDDHVIPLNRDYTLVNVLCLQLGESDVELKTTNAPNDFDVEDADNVVVVKVICGKPRSIHLQPEIKVADVDACPMDLSSRRVVVKSSQDVELEVIVRDDQGRRFVSIESLKLEWSWSPKKNADLANPDSVFIKNVTEETIVFINKSYQIVKPKIDLGVIDVNVKVVGYRKSVLSAKKVTPEYPEFMDETDKNREIHPIATSISLYLVDDTIVTPNVATVYNHPGNRKALNVKQGSGFYDLALSADDIADVKYVESSREIEIAPKKDGELTVHLIDLCLVSPPVFILIKVVSVGNLRLEMSDKVEIHRCITCIVRMYDDDDNLLDLPELGIVDLKPSLEDEIVDIQRLQEDPKEPWPPGEVHFIITGVELGDTKLLFTVPSADGEISSAPMELQVFPPLRLYPRNGTIIVGTVFQITSKGGPQPESTIEYSASLPKIAEISDKGLVKGISIGHIKISGRSVGINPTTGKKVLFAEDEIDLNVIFLTGIKIGAPLARFKKGATVPVWAAGIPEQLSPVILGSIEDKITFEWSVEDSDVAELRDIFHDIGVQYDIQDRVSMRLVGLGAGRTKVNLVVTVDASLTNVKTSEPTVTFTASLDVEVFDELQLLAPRGISGLPVLMAPLSTVQLVTNLDSIAKLRYTLPGNAASNAVASQSLVFPHPVVSVSPTGELQSYSVLGHALVIVTATDEMGLKQTLDIIVEVKPVHYMMLIPVTTWQLMVMAEKVNSFVPQGVEFELQASYYDNIGTEFSAGTSELKVRSSRFDLVKIRQGFDNSTATVSVKKTGHTVLKVWSEGYHNTVDYVKLHTEQAIKPYTDHLTSGDVICFWTPLRRINGEKGRWMSSDRGLVSIDQSTGLAKVVSAHGGIVSISHSLHSASPMQIQVKPISNIRMLPHEHRILVNTKSQTPFEVPLVLLSKNCPHKTSNLLGGSKCKDELSNLSLTFPFKCHVMFLNDTMVDPDNVFKLESGFNFATGQYVCNIHSADQNSAEISTIKSNISVWAVDVVNGVEAEPAFVPFRPAIFLPDSITVEEGSYKADLIINGLDFILNEVTVTAFDPALLYVFDAERPKKNVLKHTIQLIDYHYKFDELGDAMSLEVKSSWTFETIKVRVKTHTSGDKFKAPVCQPTSSFIYRYRHVMALLLAMVLIFLATYYTYVNMISPTIQINVSPNQSLLRQSGCVRPSQQLRSADTLLSGRSGRSGSQVQGQPTCAYLRSIAHQSVNTTPTHRYNCFCGTPSPDPVYGNSSTFYNSEVRRSRREF